MKCRRNVRKKISFRNSFGHQCTNEQFYHRIQTVFFGWPRYTCMSILFQLTQEKEWNEQKKKRIERNERNYKGKSSLILCTSFRLLISIAIPTVSSAC